MLMVSPSLLRSMKVTSSTTSFTVVDVVEVTVGLMERATGKCWLEIVRRRDSAKLEQIIMAHDLPGTVVMTDAWGGYVNVPRLNNGVYVHEVVVHAHNFVDPQRPDVHTQTIEGMWMQAKLKLRYQNGTSRDLFHIWQSFSGVTATRQMFLDNTCVC